MANVTTTYMGLTLPSPVIAASSRLTQDLDGMKRCEDAGAGAVVMKSLFEEQIDSDSRHMMQQMDVFSHTDAYDFISHSSKDYYIDAYLEQLEKAKKALDIPVIASVNCKHDGSWIEYAHRFEAVGADALELNVFVVPSHHSTTSEEIEQVYYDILSKVRKKVSIPIALKIGSHFSAMAQVFSRLDELGADALVLFNRFYKSDIDIDRMALKAGPIISVEEETALSLQWTALTAQLLSCDICANTGIHDGETVIKHLLAGASSVQICSAMMKQGHGVIGDMNHRLGQWMDEHDFEGINAFRGKLSRDAEETAPVWERSQ